MPLIFMTSCVTKLINKLTMIKTFKYASDIDPEMVEIAKRNAEEVGLGDIIQFSVKDVNTLTIDQEGPVALVGNRHTASVLEVELKLKKCIDM